MSVFSPQRIAIAGYERLVSAVRPQPVDLSGPLLTGARPFAFGALLILSFVPISFHINISQMLLLPLCIGVLGVHLLVRPRADITAALFLTLCIAVSQAIGIALLHNAETSYVMPLLLVISLLIAPSIMAIARSYSPDRLNQIVPRIVKAVLIFFVVECVSRIILSPHLRMAKLTVDSDDAATSWLYIYKGSIFYFDSNFVGIALLCLLSIMYVYREEIGGKRILLAYLLLLFTFSRASIAAGLCQFAIYKLWRWRGWTLWGIFAIYAFSVLKLFVVYMSQGQEALQEVDGSFASKFYIISQMVASYAQMGTAQRLFGIGAGSSPNVIGIFAHNVIVTLILEFGIVGSILFVTYVWIFGRRCPVNFHLLILPVLINGFALVSPSMPYFFVTLGLLGALRGTEHDGSRGLNRAIPQNGMLKG